MRIMAGAGWGKGDFGGCKAGNHIKEICKVSCTTEQLSRVSQSQGETG